MITVVGIGPGAAEYQTAAARQAVAQAEILVGGARHLALYPHFYGEKKKLDADIDQLMVWLEQRRYQQVVVLASGDPLFYGIGKRISASFPPEQVRIIPGISALQYLCAQIQQDMNDIYLTSSHGRSPDFDWLLAHPKIGMVTDKVIGPRKIADEILARGQRRLLVIGENLSQSNQRITILKPEHVASGDDMYDINVVVILNER